jgi:hypothetical protein
VDRGLARRGFEEKNLDRKRWERRIRRKICIMI